MRTALVITAMFWLMMRVDKVPPTAQEILANSLLLLLGTALLTLLASGDSDDWWLS